MICWIYILIHQSPYRVFTVVLFTHSKHLLPITWLGRSEASERSNTCILSSHVTWGVDVPLSLCFGFNVFPFFFYVGLFGQISTWCAFVYFLRSVLDCVLRRIILSKYFIRCKLKMLLFDIVNFISYCIGITMKNKLVNSSIFLENLRHFTELISGFRRALL